MKLISTAFVKAQKSFDEATKSSNNPFFKSAYADLPECIDAVLPHLHENGIAVMQPTHECSDGVIVETLFIHESGETLSGGKLHVPAAKNDPQAYGSALTYARRYSLSAACSIKTADDDGNAASKPSASSSPQSQPQSTSGATISEAQGKRLFAICKKSGNTIADCANKFGFKKLGDIEKSKYKEVCEWAEVDHDSSTDNNAAEMVENVFNETRDQNLARLKKDEWQQGDDDIPF